MKLVLVITDYGAFNNFLAELSSVIARDENYTLHIICSKVKVINIDDKAIFEKQNIHFHFLDIPRSTDFIGQIKAAFKIRALIKQIDPDLIHAHFTTSTFPTVLFRKSGYTYWSTIHGLGMNSSKGLNKIVFSIVETICFVRLNRIFVLNNEDYNLVYKFFGNKVQKYKCFGVGCDISKFNPDDFTAGDKLELKNKLNIEKDVTVIAFTGRFVHFKGFNLVIQAFRHLNETHPGKYKLILMGGFDPIHKTGLDASGEVFFNTCKDIINVGFTSEVYKYLSITDIFLFPSKKEGLPTCILEALAMGIPVVTFNARGNNDIIKNNYNGILIEPDEDELSEMNDITRAISKLASDAGERTKIGQNALKDRLKYSRENFINEHLAYYSTLMNHSLQSNSC